MLEFSNESSATQQIEKIVESPQEQHVNPGSIVSSMETSTISELNTIAFKMPESNKLIIKSASETTTHKAIKRSPSPIPAVTSENLDNKKQKER